MVIPVRWGDMDAMGHVNHALYFRYLEVVRLEWLCKIGAIPKPEGGTLVMVIALERTDAPGSIYAEGGATVVWTDFNAQKSVPLPDWLRALIA